MRKRHDRPGRFEAEAQSLLDLIGGLKVEAIASEWLSLEVVRGLKRAQQCDDWRGEK